MTYQVKHSILGFDSVTTVEVSNNDGLTSLLTSPQDPSLQLTLINAYAKDVDYEISGVIKALLDITAISNISIYFVVVINKSSVENSIINLGAPLIFNEDNKTMAQIPMTNDHALLKNI